jgi:hypothetical protein
MQVGLDSGEEMSKRQKPRFLVVEVDLYEWRATCKKGALIERNEVVKALLEKAFQPNRAALHRFLPLS